MINTGFLSSGPEQGFTLNNRFLKIEREGKYESRCLLLPSAVIFPVF